MDEKTTHEPNDVYTFKTQGKAIFLLKNGQEQPCNDSFAGVPTGKMSIDNIPEFKILPGAMCANWCHKFRTYTDKNRQTGETVGQSVTTCDHVYIRIKEVEETGTDAKIITLNKKII